jgi:hypothetical protein
MKNNIDFVYEYSDLNLFQTRVHILTGKYAGIILEFGGSVLAQIGKDNTFTFEYTLYEVPDQFYGPRLRTDGEFNQFLGYLLVDVIKARNNDPKELEKLHEAASVLGKTISAIKINEIYYPNALLKTKKQPIAQGLQGF